jgi:hypothetical protein
MKRLTFFFKEVRLREVLMVFFAGLMLFVSTACSNGNVQGARPNNPPVQMGGNNNPHKAGGDGYTNYKMSTDPKVNNNQSKSGLKKQANLGLSSTRLVADNSIKSNASDLIYSGENVPKTSNPDIGAKQQKSLPNLPNPKQPVVDRSNPDSKILERVGEAFKDATSFVKDTADSASARPEAKANPALGQ